MSQGWWQIRWVRRAGAASGGRSPPDVEAVVGVRGVLGPLEQRPLKLDGDLGDRAGRQLNEHLQEVGLQPVLGRLVVDVTWRQARLKLHPYLLPGVRLPATPAPPIEALRPGSGHPEVGSGSEKPGRLREGSRVSKKEKDVSRAAIQASD